MTAAQKAEAKNNAYKVKISGTFRTGNKEYRDFQDVVGYIPLVDREFAEAMIRRRYAKMWITISGKYKDRVQSMRSTYIDELEPCQYEFSYVGKDIKDMTYEELQDLATAKDLRAVPLYKAGGLREGHIRAYAAYSKAILQEDIGEKDPGFNFAKLPPMIIDDSVIRNPEVSMDVDDVIKSEVQGKPAAVAKVEVTRAEMEALAKARKIAFHPAISDAKLYDKIFLKK